MYASLSEPPSAAVNPKHMLQLYINTDTQKPHVGTSRSDRILHSAEGKWVTHTVLVLCYLV